MKFISDELQRFKGNPVNQGVAYLALITFIFLVAVPFILRWLLSIPLSYLVYFFATTSIVWPVIVTAWMLRKWQSTIEPFFNELVDSRLQTADLHTMLADLTNQYESMSAESSDSWSAPILDTGPIRDIWKKGEVDKAAFKALDIGKLSISERKNLAAKLRNMIIDSDEFLSIAENTKECLRANAGMPLNEVNRWVPNHALYDFIQEDFISTHLDDAASRPASRVVRLRKAIDAVDANVESLRELEQSLVAADSYRIGEPSNQTLELGSKIDRQRTDLVLERNELERQLRELENH